MEFPLILLWVVHFPPAHDVGYLKNVKYFVHVIARDSEKTVLDFCVG